MTPPTRRDQGGAACTWSRPPEEQPAVGWENFADPDFAGTTADLFFSCGNADRPVVEELISTVGLRPVFLGEEHYDTLDGVLRLWFALAVGQRRGRHLAFKVLHD
jgi:8-hydroxy-5-deazaflavin:NADPH oxidoreductase